MSANNRIGYIEAAFTTTSTTSFLIGYLPPQAYITDIKVLVTTAFTGGVLDVGNDTTAAAYADDVDIGSQGVATVSAVGGTWGTVQSTSDQTQVKGIVVAAGTTLPAGAGKVVVEFAYVD
jgi:hypothetical protein